MRILILTHDNANTRQRNKMGSQTSNRTFYLSTEALIVLAKVKRQKDESMSSFVSRAIVDAFKRDASRPKVRHDSSE